MAEKRNLLDEFEEDMMYDNKNPLENPMHQVVYFSPLAKIGSKIGKRVYRVGGGYKGANPRTIIRNDLSRRLEGGKYPFDILEEQTTNGTFPQKSLDDFVESFENVRSQRDYYNNQPLRVQGPGDILANGDVRQKQFLVNTGNMSPHLFGVDDWKKWYDAKMKSKEQGHKLGKIFFGQNQLERNVFGNVSKGFGFSTEPIPEGPYVFVLGNQNHVYSKKPNNPKRYPMSRAGMMDSVHPIRFMEDGTPVIDLNTWTHKSNIENIKKTGLVATDGADAVKYHKGTEGVWGSFDDNRPMQVNHENGVKVGEVLPDGTNYDMELLHSQIPQKTFNNMDVIHQGEYAGTKVDVVKPKPGSPEIIIEKDGNRSLKKIAIPSNLITHIPENKMRKDWVMKINGETTAPGFHPNKQLFGSLREFLEKTSPISSWINLSEKDMIDHALKNARDPEKAKKVLLDDYVYRMLGKAERKSYINRINELSRKDNTPYDLLKMSNEINSRAKRNMLKKFKNKKIF